MIFLYGNQEDKELLKKLKKEVSGKKTVLAEISGRDSIAAILKFCQENPVDLVIPSYVFAPTEYGDFKEIEKNVEFLRKELRRKYKVSLSNLVKLSNSKLWSALNGRFISLLVKKFGFYNPCLGCHLYMHIVRVSLAKGLKTKKVIAGEREYHGSKVKLNQTREAIEAYIKVLKVAGIDLVLPVREIFLEEEISQILGKSWKSNGRQLSCVLSGNYLDLEGKILFQPKAFQRYIQEFIIPVGKRIVFQLLEGEKDFDGVVRETLRGLK